MGLLQEEEAEAKSEAERRRPGLTMFADGSRPDDGATGYAVVWRNGQSWATSQEAYGTECAALARALETASRRQTTPERVTIFTDAQAAIRRMASEEPGPGQMYALQARKHIVVLRRARPDITIEIRWCPAHKGAPGNEKADERARLAAEEPDARGVEWLGYSDWTGAHVMPLPRSLAHMKREVTEEEWAEARRWAGGWTSEKKHAMPKSQRPDGTVAGSTKRLASRFYRLGQVTAFPGSASSGRRTAPPLSIGSAGVGRERGATSSRCALSGRPSRRFCGQRCGREVGSGRVGGGSERRY